MHIIRLREPWKSTWLAADPRGTRRAVYTRTFHLPTGLDAAQQIHLNFRCLSGGNFLHATSGSAALFFAKLNGTPLEITCLAPNSERCSVCVTEHLAQFNELTLELPLSQTAQLPSLASEADRPPPTISDFIEVQLSISDPN